MRSRMFVVLSTLLLAAANVSLAAASDGFAIRARVFDGARWTESALVIVSGDRIVSVIPSPVTAPPGLTVVDVAGAMLTPGFVDCDSALGILRERDEEQESDSSDLLLADAFEPDEGESEELRRSGVTLAWLAAGPTSVVGGRGALVQPAASGPPRVLARDHGLCGSLTDMASRPDRAPSSVPEQAELIAGAMSRQPAAAGLRVRHDDAGSARVATGLACEDGLIVGLPSSDETLAEIRSRATARACLSGLGPESSPEQVRLARALAAEHPFVLGTGASAAGPRTLRWAAAMLAPDGADADRVLSALTRDAARAAGSPRRGVIEPGGLADLVLWSGDPLSPASRALRVWVSGEQVHAE